MIEKLSKHAVLYRVDGDTDEGKALAKKAHLQGYPTTILYRNAGDEIDRYIGYAGRSDYIKTIMGYFMGVDTLEDLKGRSGQEADPELLMRISSKLQERGGYEPSLGWIEKARQVEGEKGRELMEKLELLEGTALLHTELERGEQILERLAMHAETERVGKEAFYSLSRFFRKNDRTDSLLELYHALLSNRQDDPSFLNGYAWFCAEKEVDLEKALAAARRAVLISDEDPGILDTLAEVYYKMGDSEEAIVAIDKALLKEPDDEYLKEQRKKFLGHGKKET